MRVRDIVINLFQCEEECDPAVAGRFAGVFHVNSQGVITVMSQNVPGATAVTAQLVFTSSLNGTVKGPIGSIASSDANAVPSLSADGQAVNVTTPAEAPVQDVITLTWSDPSGKIASFSVDLVVSAAPQEVITGAFGTFVPGTTP